MVAIEADGCIVDGVGDDERYGNFAVDREDPLDCKLQQPSTELLSLATAIDREASNQHSRHRIWHRAGQSYDTRFGKPHGVSRDRDVTEDRPWRYCQSADW